MKVNADLLSSFRRAAILIFIVAFTRKHLSGALESGHKYCH
jgi:hypothetical protein